MTRTLLALATTATAVGVLGTALAVGPADAAAVKRVPPAKTVPMAFVSDRDGDPEVFSVDKHGRARQLTRNTAADFSPVWSPDGRRIAFVSDRDGDDDQVYVMAADGSGLRQLTRNSRTPDGAPALDQAPAWSPDGRRIVFASNRAGGEAEIWVMGADGSAQTRLTRTAAYVADHTPAWSPDGRSIAFASNRAGDDNYEIFRMAPDGSGVKRLTNAPGDDNAPDWSPDGRRIAFSSNRAHTQDLYVMNADGTGTRLLTGSNGSDEVFPRWTRRGNQVVFFTFTGPDQSHEDLWVVNADGSGRKRLSTAPSSETSGDPHPTRS